MKKRILAICLVVAMAATAIVGASMAYLTDTDSDVNVMTLGNVDIELVEKQRDGNDSLEDFEQAKILYPIVGSAQEGEDSLGLPTAANYVDKIVTVDNTGKSDAWVRVIIAYPSALDATNASDMILHWNQDANFVMGEGEGYTDSRYTSKVNELSDKAVEIDGVDYNLYVFTYSQPIKADTMAMRPVLTGMYLDSRVDYDADTGTYTMNGEEIDYDFSNGVALPVYVQAVQTAGFATADAAFAAAFTNEATVAWIQGTSIPTVVEVSTPEALASAIKDNTNAIIKLADGNYTTNLKIDGGKNITITGSKDAVLSGQIATTSSTAGTLKLQGVTVKVDNSIVDSTGISQTGKSAIAVWGNQTVICENVTFNMSLADSTAITTWWDTGVGTTIIARNCTFNCNGQRPIRATGNVTVENCTFNDPYRYAVQLTAKSSTATLLDKAVVNFNNNTIVDGTGGKDFVYGIQLEGADYGCHDLIINGSGNTITADEGDGSTMYYCECGKVDHDTVVWNTEVAAVHEP